MHGTKTSNIGVSQSDLLIAIGTRFSDRVYGNAKTFASRAKIIQIDIDPAEVNKNILIDTAIIGDVKAVLTILNRRLSQQYHEAWMQEIQDMKAKYPMTYHQERLSGPGLIEKIYELTEGDAIITTEVGQHQMWQPSIINTNALVSSLLPVDLEQWDTALAQQSVPNADAQIKLL